MVDMPEGTALETTARVASALASATLDDETVVNVQQYVGTSAPYNFNGLVRHYFLRRGAAPRRPAGEPRAEGRALGAEPRRRRARARAAAADRAGDSAPRIQVAEVPPGPPVLQTLVAEVYGPDAGAADGGGRADQGDLRADARRGRYRLVRRGAAAEGHARRRRREGRGRGPLVGGRGGGRSGWPARARSSACCTTRRRARTCRSSSACRATTAVSRRLQSLRLARDQAGRRRRAHARRAHAGRAEPVSQESAGR